MTAIFEIKHADRGLMLDQDFRTPYIGLGLGLGLGLGFMVGNEVLERERRQSYIEP